MGLLGNTFRQTFGAAQALGDTVARAPGTFSSYRNFSRSRSPDRSDSVNVGAAIPAGGYSPDVFFPPQSAGEMALRSDGDGDLEADLIPAKLLEATFSGSGDLSAIGSLVVSLSVNMDGSGTISATIAGRLAMSADFTGSGDIDAALSGIADLVADLTGVGDIDATISAIGEMSVDITVTGTGLSTANVGAAVWAALSAANNEAGTMGAKLNAAASAGDPWTTELPGSYTGDEAGAIVGQKLLTLAKFLALK